MSKEIRLIAEWEKQDAVIISWPHKDTDWDYILNEVDNTYLEMAKAILNYEDLIIISPEPDRIEGILKNIENPKYKYHIIEMETNDTWIRDYGPLSFDINVENNNIKAIADFTFNAWGMKFASDKDNLINRLLYLSRTFDNSIRYMNKLLLVLEGGGIESDGKGTILSTKSVLFEANRNAGFDQDEMIEMVKTSLGAERLLMLENGALEGDDTDGHIDTLARFISENKIAYISSDDVNDSHYRELKRMEEELQKLLDSEGNPYELIKLPMPRAIFAEDGHRLPATYANFLIVNGAIIVPTYNDEKDKIALDALAKAMPEYDILGVDCSALIKQHGSLHCATMQIPQGFINKSKFQK